MIIRPKLSSVIVLTVSTSFIWGLGLIGIFQDPYDYNSYIALLGSVIIILYLATQRIEIGSGKIIFSRYYIKTGSANLHEVEIVEGKIGKPPILSGLIVRRKSDLTRIGEIAPWNYEKEDIDLITASLV